MQLVDDDAAQAGEELLGVGIGQQQRQRFRRRHQQVAAAARAGAGAGSAACRRCGSRRASAAASRRSALEVAADVGRQRLQRRDVERVQLALALGMREILAGLRRRSVSSIRRRQEARQRLAAAGRRDQQRALALPGKLDQRKLMRPGRPAATFEPAGKQVGKPHICSVGMPRVQCTRHPKSSLLALSDAARPLLRAGRFLCRPRRGGAARRDHARPWRPCPARPSQRAGHARDAGDHARPLPGHARHARSSR